ncbi:MAG: DNA primase catalytic subunit PriS [Candidatus Micrarchaeota archaeon]|nr:DNA primase catalytic subunit PriS [Candidatus Micrarchaeota archaeon]
MSMAVHQASKEEEFLRKLFSGFYTSCQLGVSKPQQREFGFGGWEKKIEFRHIGVKGEAELRARLVSDAPLYVSYSVAYYEFPAARPMVKKNWLGADLVFDLDAPAHSCGKFTCGQCLAQVKRETIQLVEEFLVPDFGFSQSEISVNFSGSRGYHVHVVSDAVEQLDREARREIADYITGTGLQFDKLFWEEGKKLFGPRPSQGGFGGKFARSFLARLEDGSFALSISRSLKDPAIRQKMRRAIEEGNWDPIGIANRKKKFQEKFSSMMLSLSGRIDSNVTADTSKLIRMPGSLHGGSGLLAKKVSMAGLEKFHPMEDAIAFSSGEAKVKMGEPVPRFSVKGEEFGPFEAGETRELPLAAAVYLLCKKAAVLE